MLDPCAALGYLLQGWPTWGHCKGLGSHPHGGHEQNLPPRRHCSTCQGSEQRRPPRTRHGGQDCVLGPPSTPAGWSVWPWACSSRGLRNCAASPSLLDVRLLHPLPLCPQEAPKDSPPAPSGRTLFRSPKEVLQTILVKIMAEESSGRKF